MAQSRHDDRQSRIRLQMDLRPPSSVPAPSGSGSLAPWTVLIDIELSRAHLTHVMDNDLFWQHPARHILPCDRVHSSKRGWDIREFPDSEDPAEARWSGRIFLFTFAADALQNFSGPKVLRQEMIHRVSIWSGGREETLFHFKRRGSGEYNPAESGNFNCINDDQPYHCLHWFWTGDESNSMSDLAGVGYRGGEDNGHNLESLVARGERKESAVVRPTHGEEVGPPINEYWDWRVLRRASARFSRGRGPFWGDFLMRLAERDDFPVVLSVVTVILGLPLGYSVMTLTDAIADRIVGRR